MNTGSVQFNVLLPPTSASFYFHPITVFEIKNKLSRQLNQQTLVV